MKEPIIIWPQITPKEVWDDCKQWVEDKGGLAYPDGEPNLMAAAGADPGCCSCPACHEYHWSYGIIHQCPTCKFIYPTDWWAMLSWGSGAGRRDAANDLPPEITAKHREFDAKRRGHPYWDYGYKHRLENPWEAKQNIDWRAEIGDCFVSGGEFRPVQDHAEQCRAVLDSQNATVDARRAGTTNQTGG